jgi:hypothetical protein
MVFLLHAFVFWDYGIYIISVPRKTDISAFFAAKEDLAFPEYIHTIDE